MASQIKCNAKPPNVKPGDRIGAIVLYEMRSGTVHWFGCGRYIGDVSVPKDLRDGMVPAWRRYAPTALLEFDNGSIAYGCECWWGPESEILALVSECSTIVQVKPEQIRKDRLG